MDEIVEFAVLYCFKLLPFDEGMEAKFVEAVELALDWNPFDTELESEAEDIVELAVPDLLWLLDTEVMLDAGFDQALEVFDWLPLSCEEAGLDAEF